MKNALEVLKLTLLALVMFCNVSLIVAQDFPIGQIMKFQSVNYPNKYIMHRNYLGEISNLTSQVDQESASFKVVPAINGRAGLISFESINFPGYYLRHQDKVIKLSKMSNTQLFKDDASFKALPGLDGKGYSFQGGNFPNSYIRHQNFKLYLHHTDNSALFKKDVTFLLDPVSPTIMNNPEGNWSYGYGTIGGVFTAFPKKVFQRNIVGWGRTDVDAWQSVAKHYGTTDVTMSGGLVYKPGNLVMHPGNTGSHLTMIRFTAPEDGNYQVNAKWTAIDEGATKSWTWVHTNATGEEGTVYEQFKHSNFKELFTKGIQGVGGSTTYNKVLKLKKGEIVSFEVGNGGDGYTNDALLTDIKVTRKY